MTIQVCAEVTAITDGTITVGGVTLVFAGATNAGIEVGDDVCLAAGTGPTGTAVVTDIDTEDGNNGATPATGGGGGGGRAMLPNTASESASGGIAGLGAVVLLASLVLGAMRLREGVAR